MNLSVIIPVYNKEEYLRNCIETVINQRYKDLEIILINDGSTDNSSRICDEYALVDNRVRVIHKSNGGLMSAWKTGFAASRGRYIGFVDSDDWIDENMYDTLLSNALKYQCDIVVCQLIKEIDKSTKIKEKLKLDPGLYEVESIKNLILPGIINDGSYLGRKLSPNRVTKLFKREIIEKNFDLLDENITFGEDLITTFSCVCDCKKILILKDFYPYHYRINNQSITGQYNSDRIYDVIKLNKKLKDIEIDKEINISEQIANDFISLALLCMELEILYSNSPIKEIFRKIEIISTLELFKQSLKEGSVTGFSTKHKIYLFLLKNRRYELFYLLRKTITQLRT